MREPKKPRIRFGLCPMRTGDTFYSNTADPSTKKVWWCAVGSPFVPGGEFLVGDTLADCLRTVRWYSEHIGHFYAVNVR